MRRLALLSSLSLLSFSLAACGDDDGVTTDASATQSPTMPTTGVTTQTTTDATDATTAGTDISGTDSDTAGTTVGPTTTGTTDPNDTDTETEGVTETETTGASCTPNDCPLGQFCNMDSGECEPGCDDDIDCNGQSICDLDQNVCTGCLGDQDCGLGTICVAGTCEPGCNDQQPCQMGNTCCDGACVDALVDVMNCGGCGNACPDIPNAEDLCVDGMCAMGDCEGNFDNCDGDAMNGCETQGSCACTPGEMQSCYTGPQGTEGKGICKAGMQTCNAQGTGFGACEGQVLPAEEVCANNLDDNCDSFVDEDPDDDNDGYTKCGGDCCDAIGPICQNPDLVNPGAFEVDGNNVDDDCDGVKDNPLPLCDNGLASNSGVGLDYAKAIDLCQFTTENAQGANKIWGVISGNLSLTNGNGSPNAASRSIRNGFGQNIMNQKGLRLAVLSSGNAADSSDSNPNFAQFQDGQSKGTSSAFPADWFAANGNSLPNTPGCPAVAGNTANDPVMLKLRIRVPTNANSFSAKMFFFSAEYPEYVCTAFNDFFVTLVDSADNMNPSDKNIAIYVQGNNNYPVGVNILKAANGLFTQCTNGQITQCGAPANYNGCTGTSMLNGTGFDITGSTPFSCNYSGRHGGGTGWLTMSGNVVPGETMEIRFAIWDSSDGLFDSLVLLDAWEWSVQASQPGVMPG
ncbi:MAG: choice-of-anchor L domain-containing protein [Nannocystaceae bacterium]|nr:choice-of-anchor L domain-containing protein [Myxococcales bacterium]